MFSLPAFPHDSFFRTFLKNHTLAREFLSIHLPQEIKELCDFNTLEIKQGHYVEEDLRHLCSDILYSLKINGRQAYIQVLIEHFSGLPEKHMPLRVLRYKLGAMKEHLDAGYDTLPLVVCLMFYHGQTSPYPYSGNILDSFEDPALAKQHFLAPFKLIDLTVIPDEEIMTHDSVALLEIVQKHIFERDLTPYLHLIAHILESQQPPRELFRSMLNYIISETEASNRAQFFKALGQSAPRYREETMTIAEELRQEGRKLEGVGILKRQLLKLFGKLSPLVVVRLEEATLSEIERWSDRIFDISRPEELFE